MGQGLVQMPEISENTHLKDLIGTDSLAFLTSLWLNIFNWPAKSLGWGWRLQTVSNLCKENAMHKMMLRKKPWRWLIVCTLYLQLKNFWWQN